MGTKANPGSFDCYAKAGEDEPMFVLLARDASAPFLVDLWRQMREGDVFGALETFASMAQTQCLPPQDDRDDGRAQQGEARECADNMREWRLENRP